MINDDLKFGLKYKTELMQHFLKGIGIINADAKDYEELKEIIIESQPKSNIWYYIGNDRWAKFDSTSLNTVRVLKESKTMSDIVSLLIDTATEVVKKPEFLLKHKLKLW